MEPVEEPVRKRAVVIGIPPEARLVRETVVMTEDMLGHLIGISETIAVLVAMDHVGEVP